MTDSERWKYLDRLDGLRDEPAKDDDGIRAELDELERGVVGAPDAGRKGRGSGEWGLGTDVPTWKVSRK